MLLKAYFNLHNFNILIFWLG